MDMGVAMVNLWVVCLSTTSCSQWRHRMRASILAQSSQCWSVRAQIWTSQTYSQGSLRANYCCCATHGWQEQGMGDRVSEGWVEMVCWRKVSMRV